MDSQLYRKYLLGNMNKDLILKILYCSNYDIPKNYEYYLLTRDIYVIGYHVNTIKGARYLPVFDKRREKILRSLHIEIKNFIAYKTLLDCGFPSLVAFKIYKMLE
tara:strand:+ start:37 stop:351 length:315 start_codon:yes stop_codon:yes gene_type:complete